MNYINTRTKIIICPVCDGHDSILRYGTNAKNCARHFLISANLSHTQLAEELENKITDLWGSQTAQILTCSNCSFTYANPFIAGNADFYNRVNHSEEKAANNTLEWEFILSKKSMIEKNKTNPLLLEIGASDGNFIKGIIDTVIRKENIYCTEFSDIGTKQLNKLGVHTFSKDFRAFNNDHHFKNKFDYICLFQVLEHLDHYDELFETFNYITNKEADIYIAVPNGERIAFNEKNKALLDLPPNHIGRFNKKSVFALAHKYNYQVVEFEIQQQSEQQILTELLYFRSLQRQIDYINFNLKQKIIAYIETNFLKIEIKLNRKNIGDNIWFCLQKKN